MSSVPSAPSTTTTTVTPAPGGAPATRATTRVPLFSADAWSPLKVELFRSLYIATSIAQIGTWAREAGSPSLMMVLTQGWRNQPDMVGRITLYSNLPICLFSLFAGALADVLDRRRLLIWTNAWMIVVSVVLGLLTLAGHVSPWGLLGMTFLLGVGTAATGPALQAVLPELVPPKDMALAINLNSVALNVARALGPATFILVVWAVWLAHGRPDRGHDNPMLGIGVSYLLSALTFIGAVWVLWQWKRAPQRAAVHGEGVVGAIRSGFHYTIHSPANRAILLRVAMFIVPALVLWSQVPVIAQNQLRLAKTPASYALLFAFVGIGAIAGVLLMPGLHARYSIDPVVNACTLLFALGLIALSFVHHLWLAAAILVFLGVNWVIIPTNFNTATQKSVPPWVKGRAISFYLTVLFGSFTVGGFLWGKVTTATNIHVTLLAGGVSMAAMLLLAPWFPLTLNEGLDLSPAYKPGDAAPASDAGGNAADMPAGPVDVVTEYRTDPARQADFLAVMHRIGQQRRRSGALAWRLQPAGEPGIHRETFRYSSRDELARQRGRMTKSDLTLIEQAHAFHTADQPPTTTHAPADVLTLNDWLLDRLVGGAVRTMEEAVLVQERLARPPTDGPVARAARRTWVS